MQRPIRVRPRPGQDELRASEWLFLLGTLAVALLLCGGSFWHLQRSLTGALSSPPTATPRPTWTPPPSPTPTPPEPTPTPTLSPTIQVGGFAKVTGAGDQGLSFRKAPSLQAERIRFLPEGTIMKVIGGPEEADGLTWWQLEDPQTGEQGWAAGAYLTPSYGP
ncbi:SH3 domain-containing protein [Thermoflexus sp.]|uniref:SH3 domain-containing protein n=1 Tax=Thermoflexus sp. TaxID=1969742 RepID=UPI0035E45146